MEQANPGTSPCPNDDELNDFVNGRIAFARLSDIELHLETCGRCSSRLGTAPADTLVKRLSKFEYADSPTGSVSWAGKPFELGPDSRYELLAELGTGGMGQVFKARHKLMKRTVALKTIRPELINHPEAVRRFAKEARAAARLSHPNIVSAFDAEQEGNLHFLVMEFVDGEGLNRIVNRNGPLDANTATDYIRQASLGLQHASERGMVHRDIKPQNLMLTGDGVVKILDFGLSKFRRQQTEIDELDSVNDETVLTLNDTQLGTEGYIAPEQACDARTADIRSDIYSLGCTFFFLLTNRAPFFGLPPDDPTAIPDVTRFRQDLDPQISAVLSRMMSHDPEQRFQTPTDVVEAIDALPGVTTDPTSQVIEMKTNLTTDLPSAVSRNSGTDTGASGKIAWIVGIALVVLVAIWMIFRLIDAN